MALWLDIALLTAKTYADRKAKNYQHELDKQQVEHYNAQLRQSIINESEALDTNTIRAREAAEGMKQQLEIDEQVAISKARAMAAANNIGAGSFADVFSNVALQVQAKEAGVHNQLIGEFVGISMERDRLAQAAEGKVATVGSRPESNLDTLLNFAKGGMSILSDGSKRTLARSFDEWFNK